MAARLRRADADAETEAARHRVEARRCNRSVVLRSALRPPRNSRSDRRVGVAFAAAAAFGYAITIICGRKMANAGLQAPTVLSIRFGLTGAILLTICLIRRRALLPAPGERVRIFLLGAIGYMVESTFFFAGLARGTAAAVTLLFYGYPALVTVIESVRERHRPPTVVLGALALSIGGCALVVTGGAGVSIDRLGVIFALCSAVAFALYVTFGSRLSERSAPMVTAAWVGLGASTSFCLRALLGPGYGATAGHWPVLIGNGAANALAFGAMFAALDKLGPARTSVVLTLEAAFTVVMSTALLHETIRPQQLLGAAAVLLAAVTIARGRPRVTEAAP